QNNANCSPLITMKLPAMISGAYEPHFSLKNMLKDGRYAQELAKEKGLLAPALAATVAAMEQAERAGRGEQDYSVIFENLQTPALSSDGSPRPESKPVAVKKQTRITLKASTFDMEGGDEEGDAEVEEPKKSGANGD